MCTCRDRGLVGDIIYPVHLRFGDGSPALKATNPFATHQTSAHLPLTLVFPSATLACCPHIEAVAVHSRATHRFHVKSSKVQGRQLRIDHSRLMDRQQSILQTYLAVLPASVQPGPAARLHGQAVDCWPAAAASALKGSAAGPPGTAGHAWSLVQPAWEHQRPPLLSGRGLRVDRATHLRHCYCSLQTSPILTGK